MCVGGSAPKIEPPSPPPPPAPPPPAVAPPKGSDFKPLEAATTDTSTAANRKRTGRGSLRIDRTTSVGGSGSGLNIPM